MSHGIKHLVRCRCVLQQFKRLPEPPQHMFTVFSVINDDDTVNVSYAQCNNCGIVHKITDICTSEIINGKEDLPSMLTIDDYSAGMPQKLVDILMKNSADLASWAAANFIYDNKRWGEFVVLQLESDNGTQQGKYVQILGESLFKVNTFTRSEYAKEKC